ncbi:MAG: fumarate hydratase [Solidesulfovibrio sp.]|uniref:fumarate hydratase n=1 Tax=Solidesulfovibrio sp. TaxID=2910990 RepID=UPI002B1FB242|nr:fumarate hydratase [Solidesulfovibrio sp.]MEA4855892.1 fumarate hydratase [Solidesulfovibrio sp.]
MRTIPRETVVDAVAALCVDANRFLPADVLASFARAQAAETLPAAREIFSQLTQNAALAAETGLPLCQDCGLGVFFVEVGEDVRLADGSLREAINAGMVKGYREGFLRKSTCDPFSRKNVGDNSPAVVHFDLVPGDTLKICMMAKGGGSENMSRVTMLAPAQGWKGIRECVIRRVAESGSNPCPPVLVGVGIGGNFELAAINSKKALLRAVDDVHPDPEVAAMEADLFASINRLGIGPMGLGGRTTCLGVKVRVAPCHLASLPLAINIQCHSARHKEVTL